MPNPWKPGQSGNPNGRPKKNRALTEILEKQLAKTVTLADGARVAGKRYVAERMVELATAGKTTLANGQSISVHEVGWFEVVKWIYAQVDGPPKTETDLNVRGALALNVVEEIVVTNAEDSVTPGTEGVS